MLGLRVKDCLKKKIEMAHSADIRNESQRLPQKKEKKVAYSVPVRRETQRMPQKELKWHTPHMLGTRVKVCRDEGNIARIGENRM